MKKFNSLANLGKVVKKIKVGVLASSLVLGGLCSNPVFAKNGNGSFMIEKTDEEKFTADRMDFLLREFNAGVIATEMNRCQDLEELTARIDNLIFSILQNVPLYKLAKEIGFVCKSCSNFNVEPHVLGEDVFFDLVSKLNDREVCEHIKIYLIETKKRIYDENLRMFLHTSLGDIWLEAYRQVVADHCVIHTQEEFLREIYVHLCLLKLEINRNKNAVAAMYHASKVAHWMISAGFDMPDPNRILLSSIRNAITEEEALNILNEYYENMEELFLRRFDRA